MNVNTRTRRAARLFPAVVALASFGLAGCAGGDKGSGPAPADGGQGAAKPQSAETTPEVAAERAKLSPEDRALVDAQQWCAVSTDSPLGSMGPPLKLTVKDQPVFVCCKSCQKRALANPDETLATVATLKARASAERAMK